MEIDYIQISTVEQDLNRAIIARLDDLDLNTLLWYCQEIPGLDFFCHAHEYWVKRLHRDLPKGEFVIDQELNLKDFLIKCISRQGVTHGSERYLPASVMTARVVHWYPWSTLLDHTTRCFPLWDDLYSKRPLCLLRAIAPLETSLNFFNILSKMNARGLIDADQVLSDGLRIDRTIDNQGVALQANPLVLCDFFLLDILGQYLCKEEILLLYRREKIEETIETFRRCAREKTLIAPRDRQVDVVLLMIGVRWGIGSLVQKQIKTLKELYMTGCIFNLFEHIIFQSIRLSAFLDQFPFFESFASLARNLGKERVGMFLSALSRGAGQGGHRHYIERLLGSNGRLGQILLGVVQKGDGTLFEGIMLRVRHDRRPGQKITRRISKSVLAEAFNLACRLGVIEVVTFLLDHENFDPDFGLEVSIEHGQAQMVRLLLDRGAKVETALILASGQHKLDILREVKERLPYDERRSGVIHKAVVEAALAYDRGMMTELIRSEKPPSENVL